MSLLRWFGARWWPGRHFEVLYAGGVDPWNCRSSSYEVLKMQRTAEAVLGLSSGAVLDVGCGEGLLAERLGRAGLAVLAVDVSPSAVDRARETCARHRDVRVELRDICTQPVTRRFSVI